MWASQFCSIVRAARPCHLIYIYYFINIVASSPKKINWICGMHLSNAREWYGFWLGCFFVEWICLDSHGAARYSKWYCKCYGNGLFYRDESVASTSYTTHSVRWCMFALAWWYGVGFSFAIITSSFMYIKLRTIRYYINWKILGIEKPCQTLQICSFAITQIIIMCVVCIFRAIYFAHLWQVC